MKAAQKGTSQNGAIKKGTRFVQRAEKEQGLNRESKKRSKMCGEMSILIETYF